ncbi:MAG: ATP-dependent protease [candidate division Zixibacteria bacterium SM23_73_2]|nr:MAG: ATP-dependent protease [candidate division Zixibacteria bacterium SM23_73_2]
MLKRIENNHKELPLEKLRWRCKPSLFKFKSTDEIPPCTEIIGQKRATDAIKMGLEMKSKGYNIFVVGLVGTGRTTTIKHLLEQLEKKEKSPDDILYVNNFKHPDQPRMILLPAGKGNAFKKDISDLIDSLNNNIPKVFDSEEYQSRRKELVQSFENRQKDIIKEFENKIKEKNFALVQVKMGPFVRPDVQPIVDSKPINLSELEKMVEQGKFSEEEYKILVEKHQDLISEMEITFKKSRGISKEAGEALSDLDKKIILPLINDLVNDIKNKYKNQKMNSYLDEVSETLISEIDRFKQKKAQPESPIPGLPPVEPEEDFFEYQVNVVVDNSETKGTPVIIETNPTYKNLFGTVERALSRGGVWKTDFSKIKAGSILQANGGYVVFNALDALVEPGVWPALKRTLRNCIVEIQAYDPFYLFTTSAIKPEPINVNVKVVMIGDDFIYRLLYLRDEDFKKIFKIKADFDSVLPKDEKYIHEYASFVKKITGDEKLLPFDASGVSGVIEFGVRLAGRQNKLSARFTYIADLIREANYWANKDDNKYVKKEHIDKAIEEWIRRVSLVENKIQEMIDEGTIMIDTTGEVVGQINGLSVLDLGDYIFGKPTRITAQTSVGKSGVINIEKEAELSGKTHNKGVLILSGYLNGKYGQDKPLVMNASLCFEQSYSGVDGDSASSTEVYAILSSLAELPLRQDIAVTGSVNQRGEIQPIGGVNEKIEGFFDVCKLKGLTGTQGVMIPHQNVEHLMLKKEVVEAVENKKFHIYPVKTIDQGIEILTRVKAGKRKDDGDFEPGTVNFLVDQKLKELAKKSKEFGVEEKSKEKK